MPDFDNDLFRTTAENAGDTSTSRIAARTGLDRGHVSRLLRGRTQPTAATTRKIAKAYKQTIDDYFPVASAE